MFMLQPDNTKCNAICRANRTTSVICTKLFHVIWRKIISAVDLAQFDMALSRILKIEHNSKQKKVLFTKSECVNFCGVFVFVYSI